MISYKEKKIVNFTADQLFDMVADVESYPEFLPWCLAARVKLHTDTRMIADLAVGFAMFRGHFTSDIRLDKDKHQLDTKSLKGPFRYFESHWRFLDLNGGCAEVDFSVEFEFSSSLFDRILRPVLTQAQRRMVLAFEQRAKELYGEK